jgi:hypothetical protein
MNTMNFEEFVRAIKTTILDYMPSKYEDASLDVMDVAKPGGVTLKGLAIRPKNSRISPTFYLNSFYSDYESGREMHDILCDIANNPAWNNALMKDSLPDFTNFEAVKDKIVAQLICRHGNERYLADRVSVTMEHTKLATVFVIELSHDDEGVGTIGITNNMLQIWGITVADIVRVANENTPRLRPVLYSDMSNVISSIACRIESSDNYISPNSPMVVCTNSTKLQGAISILYPGVADEIRNIIGDFYVLPSSVHEVILVPKRLVDDVNELYNMVHDVNATEVRPDEVLGTDVFDVVNGQFVSAMCNGVEYAFDREVAYE